jgi:hypothetical protein
VLPLPPERASLLADLARRAFVVGRQRVLNRAGPHKLERIAMEEVRTGAIQYTLPTTFEGSPREVRKE